LVEALTEKKEKKKDPKRKKKKENEKRKNKGVCHTCVWWVALQFTLKKKQTILRQTKNYGKSSISPCKDIIILKKSPLKETKIILLQNY
jgi:hypothetical protein